MKPVDSLPHSQVPVTCPFSKPDRSSPCPQIPLPTDPSYIILPSKPGSSKWSLSFRFPHHNSVYTSTLSHTRYMPRPSNFSRLDQPNNIGCGVHKHQTVRLTILSPEQHICSHTDSTCSFCINRKINR
jgi:hypothetical protein